MKKILLTALATIFMVGAMAQEAKLTVPMGVFVSNDTEIVPAYAQSILENKMRQIVTTHGVGSLDSSSFFITCFVACTDKQVLGGAPVKVIQKVETTFYIADIHTKRLYESVTLSHEGIGKSENEALANAFNSLNIRSSQISSFIASANDKIVDYYESQLDFFIAQAEAVAKLGDYNEALFILACIPDVCEGYEKVNEAALGIYQIMIDYDSLIALQHAKAAWASSHSYEAAVAACEYLAQVSPYSTCYAEAEALAAEIKAFGVDEHSWTREQTEQFRNWYYQHQDRRIEAWRDVGMAYGNNQQPINYEVWWH